MKDSLDGSHVGILERPWENNQLSACLSSTSGLGKPAPCKRRRFFGLIEGKYPISK